MRSPDLPEILIGAGLIAYVAFGVFNWLHCRKERGSLETTFKSREPTCRAPASAKHDSASRAEFYPWVKLKPASRCAENVPARTPTKPPQ